MIYAGNINESEGISVACQKSYSDLNFGSLGGLDREFEVGGSG